MKRAVVGILLFGACADDGTGPRISGATPASARAGATVDLAGERFCGETPDCTNAPAKIDFDLDVPVRALVLAFAQSSATLQVPALAPGPTEIVLTVDGRSSNAVLFQVLP